MWGPATGWTRVSRGSHSGHVPTDSDRNPRVPGRDLHERTSSSYDIRLVPLETVDRDSYRRLAPDVTPPWLKDAWKDPATDHS
jgi:hypothetical protein